uniref:Uncharacterized protein n=1 Tax=Rhizophora mucronata TaxID=61149 RepID=A0A2P2NJM7_RHIMU
MPVVLLLPPPPQPSLSVYFLLHSTLCSLFSVLSSSLFFTS